jgi:nucleoside-diphosphate-sugar epimerase
LSSLLIIGGSGFFGKSIINYYNTNGFNNWKINRLEFTSRRDQRIMGHQPIVYNIDHSPEALPEADYIIYAASSTNIDTYRKNPKKEIDKQKKGMENFHNYISKLNRPPKKILFTSSGAIYGETNLNSMSTSEEKNSPEPDDNNDLKKIYANIKMEWENFFKVAFPSNSIIARCFAFVGPHLPLDQHFAIGNFIKDYLNKKNISVKSQYAIFRSYMYADDLVEWLLTLLVADHSSQNRVFNIGSDQEIELHNLANLFNQRNNFLENNLANCSKVERYVPNIDLIKNSYDLKVSFNLDSAISETINLLKAESI